MMKWGAQKGSPRSVRPGIIGAALTYSVPVLGLPHQPLL